MTVPATAARVEDTAPSVSHLGSRLDVERLRRWGWDPLTGVLTVDPARPVLGYSECPVAGCDYETSTAGQLCAGCALRWGEVGGDWERFVATPMSRQRYRRERLCRVCRRPGHQRPAKSNGLCMACEGLRRHRHQSVEAYVGGDERFRPAAPRPTIGICLVGACDRLAAYRYGLCDGHQNRWARAGRPELGGWCATVDPLLGDRGGRIALTGLPERFVTEFLFGIQVSVDAGIKRRLADLRAVTRRARQLGSGSLAELADSSLNSEAQRFVSHTLDAIELAAKTPEAESASDVWDLRVWGFAGKLSFIGGQPLRHLGHLPAEPIRQEWLRDAAKAWAASRLPLLRTPSTVRAVVTAVGRWSAHLGRRPDGGHDPAALTKDEVASFLAALRVLVNQGQLSAFMHNNTVKFVRQFLRDCRDLELDEHGGPLRGLPRSVIVARDEIPPMPDTNPDDEVGDAIPDAVLAQLLDDTNLARLAPDARRRFLIGLEVGRRPSELCGLAFGCLAYDGRVNQTTGRSEMVPVLVHNMGKVNKFGCRLPIHSHTAQLISEQQVAVRDRFPDTPESELVLFPALQRHKNGRRPIGANTWASELRTWADQLELFEGWLDGEGGVHLQRDATGQPIAFDPARIVPYALRHTYAQRHVNAGTPVEVLKELMRHDKMDTTSGYYRITSQRKRDAIQRVLPLQVTASGARLLVVEDIGASDTGRYVLSQIAVPMGSCTEPSNVRAQGTACDFRYKCFGCIHFRTDPAYLPELRAYLTKLLAARERLTAAVPALAEWARQEAVPSDNEIETVRRLVAACQDALGGLDPDDRGAVEEAIRLLRQARVDLDTSFPVQFRGLVTQPAPTLFPTVETQPRAVR
ncbi:MAG TPA: site-specific integrase [Jiangellaceae bacterium]|nr:site-specific integrase [Jiangellaceae bacterium]